jgi:tetratricopeptide (TPR) repeat protein
MTPTFQDAVALHAEGRFDEAATAYRNVLEHGEHFGAAYNLSLLYASAGRYAEALTLAREAVRLGPSSAEAYDHLGGVLVELGKHALAISQFEAALRIEPRFARACNNLGAALQALGRVEESIPWLQRALELRPDYVDARLNLGTSLELLNRYREARDQFDRVTSASPGEASAYGKIGSIESMQGHLGDAVEAYQRGVERDPRSGRLYNLLAGATKLSLDDPHVRAMEHLLREVHTLHVEDQIGLHFALGKVYIDNGRFVAAIERLKAANAIVRQTTLYDEAATLESFAEIARVFTPAAMRELRGTAALGARHVFVLGMPRSGTTLVEQILASHPRVHGAGELETFREVVAEVLPAQQVALTPELLEEIGRRYEAAAGALADDADRITDKMPSNFRYAGLIHLALPNAKIVHTRRDPIDTCLSCFAQNFSGDQPFAYDLAELGRYYRSYERLMAHWRNTLPEGTMLDVQYEELVGDFESQARRIVEYVGLDWDPAVLQFYKTERSVRTASVVAVRHPIYRTSIGRWEPYRNELSPLFEALGS